MPGDAVLQSIRTLLDSLDVERREVRHEPTFTSAESARARGEPLQIGGKALLMKGDGSYRLFVVPADRKVDSGAVRATLKLRKLRFASPEELLELTGLVPGSVPPFGRPILPFELFVDEGVRENAQIAFNAGTLTDSMILAVDDYLRAAAPAVVFPFSSGR